MLLYKYLSLAGLLAPMAQAAPTHQVEKRALPRLGGVNLAGCEFGIQQDGSATGGAKCPDVSLVAHYVADGANAFRIPFGWQYITPSWSSTSFNTGYFNAFDKVVRAVLNKGAYAMIDLHNYARWDGKIVGQGGPTNADLASMWSLLAKKYANEPKVIFGIMNEPHDLNMDTWATTVQASVNAIRAAGATSQAIALPGTVYDAVGVWGSGQSDAMLRITDPAHGNDKSLLIIDAHQYLDDPPSGVSRECANNGVANLQYFERWLNKNGRKAIISETGGGNTASCVKNLGEEINYIKTHPNVFVGFTVWAAGSWPADYELNINPDANGNDNNLFNNAVKGYLPG
ncbi:hypothetical protein I350_07059 [Cryptococcus amylolentus CBS 6273]|nr:hypothetical protein I350_07059 [Cryptococcus amylolentus CBS 6273]